MLNRRILRVKAMQALFSYQRSKEAGVALAEDQIEKAFEDEIHNTLKEEQQPIFDRIKQSKTVFKEEYTSAKPNLETIETESDRKAILKGVSFYKNHLREERVHYQKVMMNEVDMIYKNYLLLLRLPFEFCKFVAKDRQRKQSLPNKVSDIQGEFNLENNFFITKLSELEDFGQQVDKYKVDWTPHENHVISWYKDIIKTNPDYLSYQKKLNPTVEDDLYLIRMLYRDIVFGNDTIGSFLEEHDLWWSENKAIVKSMIKKTLKNIDPQGADQAALVQLLVNEEEDLDFFKNLYNFTLDNDDEFEVVVGERAQNWDKERVAAIDKTILKMAMTELVNFYSIPIKVTINEYIELSKNYSTPKSKQFINGILDRLSEDWLKSGKIRKSGRGLMDNK